jgi:hypothetical protein
LRSLTVTNTRAESLYKTSIYADEALIGAQVKLGEEVFGFYKRGAAARISYIEELWSHEEVFDGKPTGTRTQMFYDGVVTQEVIDNLTSLASRQLISFIHALEVILKSPTAFKKIPKEAFCIAMANAIQQPSCAGYYAFNALAKKVTGERRHYEIKDKTTLEVIDRLTQVCYQNDCRGIFLLSGEELRTGVFKADPFTSEEIKAIPFLLGFLPEVYACAGQNYSACRDSCARKLNSAGFTTEANLIQDVAVEKLIKPKTKLSNSLPDNDVPSP